MTPASGGLLDLPRRSVVRHRNGVAFSTVRSWRAADRRGDLIALKAEKRGKGDALLDVAAADLAGEARAFLGGLSGWCVSCVACGHSRDPECWGKLLARRTASLLGATFVEIFADRFVSGSSHPKEFKRLPPLEWRNLPSRPCLVIDDVVTSGWHMEEALGRVRAEAGIPAVGLAWIGGTVTDRPDALPDEEPEPPTWAPAVRKWW